MSIIITSGSISFDGEILQKNDVTASKVQETTRKSDTGFRVKRIRAFNSASTFIDLASKAGRSKLPGSAIDIFVKNDYEALHIDPGLVSFGPHESVPMQLTGSITTKGPTVDFDSETVSITGGSTGAHNSGSLIITGSLIVSGSSITDYGSQHYYLKPKGRHIVNVLLGGGTSKKTFSVEPTFVGSFSTATSEINIGYDCSDSIRVHSPLTASCGISSSGNVIAPNITASSILLGDIDASSIVGMSGVGGQVAFFKGDPPNAAISSSGHFKWDHVSGDYKPIESTTQNSLPWEVD